MPRHSKISQTPADPSEPRHMGAIYVEGIPETTKIAFKSKCALRKTSMRDAIIMFMREYVKLDDD